MRVDTMRRIDRYAGVPLCFLLTLLMAPFRSPWPVPVRRALFIELSEMGSAVLADPAMRKLRAAGAELYFVIFAQNAASLRLLATVPEANVFTIRATGLWPLLVDTLRFLVWSRRQGIDTVIDLELFSRYTALLTGLCGARNRIGFHRFHNEGLYRGELLSRRVAYNPHQHIAKNFIALVDAALAPGEELPFSKRRVADEELALAKVSFAEETLLPLRARVVESCELYAGERLVLINPNASELLPQRRWPAARYIALMQRLLERYDDILILITGAPTEREEAERLRQQVGSPRCINFAGRVAFAELPQLYTIASLMVTNDSGPGHFSAVTDLPTFVLFGPETPALYGSLGNSTPIYAGLACSPCVSAANHRKTACSEPRCMTAIEVEEVVAALLPVLGEPTQGEPEASEPI